MREEDVEPESCREEHVNLNTDPSMPSQKSSEGQKSVLGGHSDKMIPLTKAVAKVRPMAAIRPVSNVSTSDEENSTENTCVKATVQSEVSEDTDPKQLLRSETAAVGSTSGQDKDALDRVDGAASKIELSQYQALTKAAQGNEPRDSAGFFYSQYGRQRPFYNNRFPTPDCSSSNLETGDQAHEVEPAEECLPSPPQGKPACC